MGKNMRNEGKKEKKGLLELERDMRRKEDLGVLYGHGSLIWWWSRWLERRTLVSWARSVLPKPILGLTEPG